MLTIDAPLMDHEDGFWNSVPSPLPKSITELVILLPEPSRPSNLDEEVQKRLQTWNWPLDTEAAQREPWFPAPEWTVEATKLMVRRLHSNGATASIRILVESHATDYDDFAFNHDRDDGILRIWRVLLRLWSETTLHVTLAIQREVQHNDALPTYSVVCTSTAGSMMQRSVHGVRGLSAVGTIARLVAIAKQILVVQNGVIAPEDMEDVT